MAGGIRIFKIFALIFLVSACLAVVYLLGFKPDAFVIFPASSSFSSDLVLNLTFDDSSSPWTDYSGYDHEFTPFGSVEWLDRAQCKINGCADFSADGGADYLNSSSKFQLSDGIAVAFWLYPTISVSGANSFDIMDIGHEGCCGGPKYLHVTEAGYGMNLHVWAQGGEVKAFPGDTQESPTDQWTFYFLQYDKQRSYVWKNGELVVNSSTPFGTPNMTSGSMLRVGAGIFSQDIVGYLDELRIWRRSNFSTLDVQAIYNEERLGSPPEKDIYVKSIRYTLPRDYTGSNLLDPIGEMPLSIIIRNAGSEPTGPFVYKVDMDGTVLCEDSLSLSGMEETEIICNWEKSYGWHSGFVKIDTDDSVEEDVEDNNAQRIYIPFKDRPWFHFSLDEYNSYIPFCSDPENEVAYDSCNWINNFVSSDWNEGYSGDSADPYAVNARQAAMSCMHNGYENTNNCKVASDHIHGWLNRSLSSFTSNQAFHQYLHVAIAYDMMVPYFTQEEQEDLSRKAHDICQLFVNHPGDRPDLDNDALIAGDNGLAFGSGMGGFCYSFIGEYAENPTLIHNLSDQYWGKNIPDEWMDREDKILQSYKNDSWHMYQEGYGYRTYAFPHLADVLWMRYRNSLIDIEEYNNAFCAMAREHIVMLLDGNYKGSDSRNDEPFYLRSVQKGDSNSYQKIDDSLFTGWDTPLFFALMCDDLNTKKTSLWIRQYAFNISESSAMRTYPLSYLYKQILDSVDSEEAPESAMPKIVFDNAEDTLIVRTNYTFSNDTFLMIDGGEERGMGHSQAQGYYLYILGEPFIDYEQVPYEDDTRADFWKNGISLANDTQNVEGLVSYYRSECGEHGQNQYYGMKTCDPALYPADYPNFRQFPLQYGGDIEDYMGTADANLAGAFVWRPYYKADPVKEYFVKFGDTVVKRTKVSGVTQGDRIYHNFINIDDEFASTVSGLNWTARRTNAATGQDIFLSTQLIYSDSPVYFGGGRTNVNYCFSKTSCSGGSRGLGKYGRRYYYTDIGDPSLDLVFSHHWNTFSEEGVTAINGTEKGLIDGGNTVLFDGDNDGTVSYAGKSTDGWALAYSAGEIAAFNATYIHDGEKTLFESDQPTQAHLRVSSERIVLTANTMERDPYIDVPKTRRVTVDCSDLSLTQGFIITKDDGSDVPVLSVSGNMVTFDITTGQNSNYYVITGSGEDISYPELIHQNITTNQTGQITIITNEATNSTIWTILGTVVDSVYTTVHTFFFQDLTANAIYDFNVTTCDRHNNCITNSSFFRTLENEPEDITPPAIIAISNNSISSDRFRVSLTLNESGNASLFISTYADLSAPSYLHSTAKATSHQMTATGLENDTDYYWKVNGTDRYGNAYSSGVHNLRTRSNDPGYPNASKFDGHTTDFNRNNLTFEGITLEISDHGRINLRGEVNVTAVDLDSFVGIEDRKVYINSSLVPVLNRSARITFYHVTLADPVILKDGLPCPICENISLGENVSFDVPHFTEYSLATAAVEEEESGGDSGGGGGGSGGSGGSGGGGGGGGSFSRSSVVKAEPEPEIIEKTSSPPVMEQPSIPVVPEQQEVRLEEKSSSIEEPKQAKNSHADAIIGFLVVCLLCSILFFIFGRGGHKKRPADGKLMTKKAARPLVLPEGSEAHTLYDFARHLHAMSEDSFRMLSNTSLVQQWVSESVGRPDVAKVLMSSDSRLEMYRVLYNIYLGEFEPQKSSVLKLPENVINLDFRKKAEMPLQLLSGLPLHSLEGLYLALPYMADNEYEYYRNSGEIRSFLDQHCLEIPCSTRSELFSSLKMIRQEKQVYELLRM